MSTIIAGGDDRFVVVTRTTSSAREGHVELTVLDATGAAERTFGFDAYDVSAVSTGDAIAWLGRRFVSDGDAGARVLLELHQVSLEGVDTSRLVVDTTHYEWTERTTCRSSSVQ